MTGTKMCSRSVDREFVLKIKNLQYLSRPELHAIIIFEKLTSDEWLRKKFRSNLLDCSLKFRGAKSSFLISTFYFSGISYVIDKISCLKENLTLNLFMLCQEF